MTATPAQTAPSTDLAGAVARAAALGAQLRATCFERDAEVKSLLTALAADEHVLLLGPPGTGKSYLTNLLCKALGGRFFGVLMTKFSVPEEVFGPYSLAGLEADQYRRVTDGYLPTADIAFLDECFKANSSILNSLLTVLNEREFDNGGVRGKVPLRMCVGASNELPADDTLGALYDRFMVRHWVAPIKARGNLRALLGGGKAAAVTATLSPADVDALRAAREAVVVPDSVLDALLDLRDALEQEHGITASDRRWCAVMRMVRASAVLDGRSTATTRDLGILAHCLWRTVDERAAVAATVAKAVSPRLGDALRVYDAAIEQYEKGLSTAKGTTGNAATAALGNTNTELIKMARQVDALATDGDPEIADYAAKIRTMQQDIARTVSKALGLSF